MYILPKFFQQPPKTEVVAAVDLGSNSFHMIVARFKDGQIHVLDRLKEMVRLGGGLDKYNYLSEESQQRALDCLARFGQRLSDMPVDSVRVVGTNVFRAAVNAQNFLPQAEQALGHPIEIVSGREEARLIYLGVAHTLASTDEKTLVVDIGGGSTEFIIGERFEPKELESLHMGCVSYTQRYFSDGTLSEQSFRKAENAAMRELLSIRERYRQTGWTSCVGSSGSIKAIKNAVVSCGLNDEFITRKALEQLKSKVLSFADIETLEIPGIKPERMAILPAGLAILIALFDSLGIEEMAFSDGALREGLLYDMAGRLRHEDVRERSISALSQRYYADEAHAQRVEQTALLALAQVKASWKLNHPDFHEMLSWAACTHEIGLTIAHSQFHKHSAYLLQHSDLAGFSNSEQQLLAFLVRGHRRKFPKEDYRQLPEGRKEPFKRLCALLRLSVILNRSRSTERLPAFSLTADNKKLDLTFPEGWLTHHPLTHADLEQEIEYLKNADIKLTIT